MWRSVVNIFYTTVQAVADIIELVSSCLSVLIVGMIFIVEIYRSLGRVIVGSTADQRRTGDGTDEAGRS